MQFLPCNLHTVHRTYILIPPECGDRAKIKTQMSQHSDSTDQRVLKRLDQVYKVAVNYILSPVRTRKPLGIIVPQCHLRL